MIKNIDFFSNLVKFAMPTILTLLIGIIAIPILSRIYPAEEYAKINMFYTTANIIYSITFLGLDSAYTRYYYALPSGISQGQLLSLAISTALILNIFVFIFFYSFDINRFSMIIYGETNYSAVMCLFVYIVGLILFRMANLYARMSQNACRYCTQQLSQNLVGRILFALIVYFSTYYLYSIIFIALMTFVMGIYYIWQIRKQIIWKIPSIYLTKEIFVYALPLMPVSILLWLNNSAAKLLLSTIGDFASLGIFSMACTLANAFAALPCAFAIYWAPFMYQNFASEQTLIKKVHDIITLFCLLLCISMLLVQDILYLYIGDDYRASQPYFMLLLLSPISSVLCETTSYGINIAKKSYISLIIVLTSCIFNIGICYILLKKIGVLGAPIGIGISAIYQMIIRSIVGQHYYVSISNPMKSLIAWSLIVILCIVNLYIYNNLTARISIFIITLNIVIYLYKDYFIYIFRQIFQYIRIKET